MHCEEVLKQLTAFSSGELSPDVRQNVQAHLAECAPCRAALGRIDAVAGVLAGVETPPAPQGFASRVMAAARQRQRAEPTGAWNPLRWWRLTSAPMHAAAATVLVIGLCAGLVMGWTATSSTDQASAPVTGDPLAAYQLDVLGETPSGSLAEGYLTLVGATNEGGR